MTHQALHHEQQLDQNSEVQNTSTDTRHHSRSRLRLESKQHLLKYSQKKVFRFQIISSVLGGLLFLVILLWIITTVKLTSGNENLLQERAKAREQVEMTEKLQSENDSLNTKIENLKHDIAQLVEGRVPGLLPLELDITVPIEKDYFRNIRFVMTGTSHDRHYEYNAVMHNEGTKSVKPNVTLFMFDERGLQVGSTILSNANSAPEIESSDLTPGESRSYSNQIKLRSKATPMYFLIDLK